MVGNSTPIAHSSASSSLQPHSPIVIRGNLGFTSGNGVTAGSGILTDPFVIRGWNINASSVNGITVANTTVYFRIESVSVHDGTRGIFLANATHSVIQNSNVESNQVGVLLESSPNDTISNDLFSYNYQAIVSNNSKGVVILDNTLTFQKYNYESISLNSSPDSVIRGNYLSQNWGAGIVIAASPNVQISYNNASSNLGTGIYMRQSSGGRISNNNVTKDYTGIDVYSSPNSTISSNIVSWNGVGLLMDLQSNDTVSNNSFTFDTVGIRSGVSGSNVTIQGNRFVYDGLVIGRIPATLTPTFKVVNNTVNSKPLLFYKDCANMVISSVPVGQLIAVNCRKLQITNLQITNTDIGLQLYNVNDTTITNNSVNSNAQYGLQLLGNNITVTFNSISNNPSFGAMFPEVQPFLAHHNNFIDDSVTGDHKGAWDNGYPSGGNFWSDYTGVDNCSGPSQNICPSPDGIGDTPYVLIGGPAVDHYPLIKPYLPIPDTTPPTWLSESTLITSNSSSTGLTLSWTMATDDVGISYYQLYEGNKVISTSAPILPYNSILLSRYVSGLTPGTVYSFKVEAVDWAGNASTSGPSITVTTESNGPSVVAWWIQYWYLVAITGVAIGGMTAAIVFRRRRKTAMGMGETPHASASV
jgi:parallel beta-helix repeat protein